MVISFILFRFINETELLFTAFHFMVSILIPLIWACIIAYLLNPLMQYFERVFRLNRLLSVTLVYLLVIFVLAGTLFLIIPRITNSVIEIIKDVPRYIDVTSIWLEDRLDDVKAVESIANTYNVSIEDLFDTDYQEQLQNIRDNVQGFVIGLFKAVFDFTSGVFKFLMGIIISFYLLKDKEKFKEAFKKNMHVYLGHDKASWSIQLFRDIDKVFSKYLVGKTIDSIIIGLMCFVGLMLLKVKYAMLLSIIVGLTNMIPYFGPFIGAVPAIILTLFSSPLQALWVALFIFVLQQLDGLVIGPKILGDSVGTSPFWIIIAIIIGGGMFGVLGMLIAVPIMAVIRNLNNTYVDKKVRERGIQVE